MVNRNISFIVRISVFMLWIYGSLSAQVNTESMRKIDLMRGITTSGELHYQINKGNSEYNLYKAQLRFDFKKRNYHTFLISNYKYGEQNKKKLVNKAFIHWRGVRTISKQFAGEVFAQIEYNDFINLNQRRLAGIGIRTLALAKKDRLSLHIGIGAMWEHENYTDSLLGEKNIIRSTNYISGKYKINKIVNFYVISYYQMDVKSMSDFRILMDSGLDVKLFKGFSFIANLGYRYDNEPPPGIKDYDLTITNGIRFIF